MSYRLAVLGDPVSHSRSPAMHEAGLRALGLEGSYAAIRATSDEMAIHAQHVRSGHLTGANITMPHKRLAALLADSLTDRAARAGSVNTWLRPGGELVGDSTDIPGVVTAMRRRNVPAERVLVLGTGGAAAAGLVALDGADLWVAGRSSDRASALIRSVGVEAEVIPWGVPVPGATVVNATPIGMRGESLPRKVIEASSGLFDMVYGDRPTPSVTMATDEYRVATADGLDLLVAQAEISFELWTGSSPPEGLFEEVARNASSP